VDDALRFRRDLRQLRREAGLESAELAARAHYPHDVIAAAESGPDLPELPVLSAYVRGCGGVLAEWEERWRSATGSPATSLHLPARPAGSSSLAEAGAQAAYASPAVDPEDQRRILAAITRAATEAAETTIPAQQSPGGAPAGALWDGAASEWAAPEASVFQGASVFQDAGVFQEAPVFQEVSRFEETAASGAAAAATAAPVTPSAAASVSAAAPAAPQATPVPRRTIGAGRAALPYGAGIAAMIAAIMCIVGMVLLLLR
jgi:hypothetical protein